MRLAKLTLPMLALGIMLSATFAFTSRSTSRSNSEQVSMQISYYWFDPSNNYLGRQTTLATEMAMTGYNESTQNPKTLREKGWSPSSVTIVNGTPVPLSSTPDKELYSHP